MAERLQICLDCYQTDYCEAKKPVITHCDDILLMDETTGRPQECFLYVCGEGWIAAVNRIRTAKHINESGLLPFGTPAHKPFISTPILTGRYIAWNVDGFDNGDIVVQTCSGDYIKTTNIFKKRPQ